MAAIGDFYLWILVLQPVKCGLTVDCALLLAGTCVRASIPLFAFILGSGCILVVVCTLVLVRILEG